MDRALEEIRRAGHGAGPYLSVAGAHLVEANLPEVLVAAEQGLKGDFSGRDMYFLKEVSTKLITLISQPVVLAQHSNLILSIGEALSTLKVPRLIALGTPNADIIARNSQGGYVELVKYVIVHVENQTQSDLIDVLLKILKSVEASRYLDELLQDVVITAALAPSAASKLNGYFVDMLKQSRGSTQSSILRALSSTIAGNADPVIGSLSLIMNVLYYEPKNFPAAKGIFVYVAESAPEEVSKTVIPVVQKLMISSNSQEYSFDVLTLFASYPHVREQLAGILSKIERSPSDFSSKSALKCIASFLSAYGTGSEDSAKTLKIIFGLVKQVYGSQVYPLLSSVLTIASRQDFDIQVLSQYQFIIEGFKKDRDPDVSKLASLIDSKIQGTYDQFQKDEEEKKQKEMERRAQVVERLIAPKAMDSMMSLSKLLGIEYSERRERKGSDFSVLNFEIPDNLEEKKEQEADSTPPRETSTLDVVPEASVSVVQDQLSPEANPISPVSEDNNDFVMVEPEVQPVAGIPEAVVVEPAPVEQLAPAVVQDAPQPEAAPEEVPNAPQEFSSS
eukprot:TRINITY_DN78207_c0_g1_i1.p1 TRINITY_DN78207_c0_g1~~TRINITY_DN78207_c0_g1_i1.p1  ORF type:complete len:577 (-),score=169.85 TRINITY_DN78207_c0_g1_i1:44-1726(-)